MVKYLHLSYDKNNIVESIISSSTPTPGLINVWQVNAIDSNGVQYIIYDTFSNVNSDTTSEIISGTDLITIIKKNNPNKVVSDLVFVTKSFSKTNRLVPGEYVSKNGSKWLIDESPIRKMCIKLKK